MDPINVHKITKNLPLFIYVFKIDKIFIAGASSDMSLASSSCAQNHLITLQVKH